MPQLDEAMEARAKEVYDFTKNEFLFLSNLKGTATNRDIAETMGMTVAGVAGLRSSLLRRRGFEHEQVIKIAMWLQTGRCPIPRKGESTYKCEHNSREQAPSCGQNKGMGEFPFWPVDMRCRDCIASQLKIFKDRYTAVQQRKSELAERLELAIEDSIPSNSTLAALVTANCGGWDAVAQEMADLAMSGTGAQRQKIFEWIIDHAKEPTTDWSKIDINGMNAEQTNRVIVDALLEEYRSRKSATDIRDIAALLEERGAIVPSREPAA